MCRVLEVSKSGFFAWLKRDHDAKAARKAALTAKIAAVHVESRFAYGSPRIFRALKDEGLRVGKRTVERVMKASGIRGKRHRRFLATTDSKHGRPVAANLAARGFAVGEANRLWCGDITCIWTFEGWLYLAAIIDCGTRKIVGWAMGETADSELVISALDQALSRQRPAEGLVFHSDRGSQYASEAFQTKLRDAEIAASMSRKGNCWDNAVMESFFGTLKVEHVDGKRFMTRKEAASSVFEWIEVWYNRRRMHSALGYRAPECYERALANCA